MGDLTAHFSSDEFKCRDGSEHPIDCKLLAMLEAIRCHFGVTTITSGYRSPTYNALPTVGGAPDSYHIHGMAADIQVKGHSPKEIYDWADNKFPISGLGLYENWIHIDCRDTAARW